MEESISSGAVKRDSQVTPLAAVLVLTFVCSLATGVFWHAVPFIAKHSYGFPQTKNLLLAFSMGAVYTLGAFTAGRLIRYLEHRLSARGVLAVAVTTLAVVCLAPVIVPAEWALWVAALVGTYVTSLIWPIVESYLTAGRHGQSMRSALGWFNLTWAPAVAIPMFVLAPILETHGQWAIGGFAGVGLLGLVALRWFAPQPGRHDAELAVAHVGREYHLLLRSARVLLPLSYVLNSAMNPILPYRFEALGVDVWWETPSAATWIVVRVAVFAIMWRMGFWHGRWGTLLLGAVAMTGGFALVVAGPTLASMLVGFAVLGVGLGVVYYAALYYALAVGHARIDAGGTHEGLIGAGYAAGPLVGLGGSAFAGGAGIVGTVWGLVGVASIPALRPYLEARRRRRSP